MDRKEVDSSSISEIGYDVTTGTLEVAFNNGGVYRYLEVPDSLYQAFETCDSKGRFFNQNIRNVYRCVRVEQAP
ncbi:MAG TPA: KTSC domain-containing protein [Terriglobia bacterium]|nr:KTSC domain-containing protein [Terriglobia bacterium]